MAAVQKIAQQGIQRVAQLGGKVTQSATEIGNQYTPQLQTFWGYARKELAPPSQAELGGIQKAAMQGVKNIQTGAFLNYTVKEATHKVLIGVEVFGWFCVGEIIGRRHIIGYKN
eukprot:Nk52_evm41s2657 gene=Nk52_evmTU41s2657